MNAAKQQAPARRQLRFESVSELRREIERIIEADRKGRLRTSGAWTPGQNLGHVAAWINYAYDGFPVDPPPWFVRIILRFTLRRYLKRGLPSGVRIPKAPEGTYGMDRLSTPEGAAELLKALDRLESDEPAKYDSPAFGPMSHADRIQLNVRHAELHLGFLHYD